MAGLLSLVIALRRGEGAPNALLRVLNPHLRGSLVRREGAFLPCQPARVGFDSSKRSGGVSSFGFTGTIAHLVVSSAGQPALLPPRSFTRLQRRSFPIPGKPVVDQAFTAALHPRGWHAHGFDDTSLVFRKDKRMREAAGAHFAPIPPPSSQRVVVVGGGISGVCYATEWVSAGWNRSDLAVLEQESCIGGIWMAHANAYSRVQTAEPAYRLPCNSVQRGPVHQTYSFELMNDLKSMVDQYQLGDRVFTHTRVERVAARSGGWVVSGKQLSREFSIQTEQVVLCVNRRLSNIPNSLQLKGEESFGGDIRSGLHNDCEGLSYSGRRVVILGFGAYAVENLRHSLESGAAHAQILCRRRGTVSPKPIDWCNYVRPRETERGFRRAKKGDARLWASWVNCYTSCGAVQPECWSEGKVKPDGHGISVADLFFVAHHLGKAGTLVDAIDRLEKGSVLTSRHGKLQADVLLKCIGFKENQGSERLTGHSHMTCMLQGRVAEGCYVQAEAFLDGSNTENVFGMSVILLATFNARLLFRLWSHKALPSLERVPRDRIGHVKFSNLISGGHMLQEADADIHQMLKELLADVTHSFVASSSPHKYFERSKQEWADYHTSLEPSLGRAEFAPYPFDDLRDLIAEEAPELMADAPTSTPEGELPGGGGVAKGSAASPSSVVLSTDKVVEIAKEVMDDAQIDADTQLLDAGLDSLGATALRQAIQDVVGKGTAVPAALVFELPTAREIAASLSTPEEATATSAEHGEARVTVSEASSGWVIHNRRLIGILDRDFYSTIWYSFPTTRERAEQMFECAKSLRTSFFNDRFTTKMRWRLREHLPVFDRTVETPPWTDWGYTFFYESSRAEVWANHT
ncbi:MAG: hypothetical protein SGPRY_004948, partial [Prymnesium sp.]